MPGDHIGGTHHGSMVIYIDVEKLVQLAGRSAPGVGIPGTAPEYNAIVALGTFALIHEYIHAGSPGMMATCDHISVYRQALFLACEIIEDLKLLGYDVSVVCSAWDAGKEQFNNWWHLGFNAYCGSNLDELDNCDAC